MRRILLLLAVLGLATPLAAQTTTNVTATDTSTGARTQVGDNTNHAIRANIITSANITVLPGNTANTTPWLFTISQGGNSAVVNGSGQLSVVCANCSGSGVSQVDNTGFTYGTTVFVPFGGVYNTTITSLTSGDAGAAALTIKRKVHTALFASDDTAITQTGGALDINIKSGGSTTVTEAATITANQSNSALTASVLYGFDGSTDSRLRTRAGTINSADVGLVTRPFLPSDGTNTQPAMDAAARPGFQKFTDGTNTAQIDPCEANAQTSTSISMTSATTTRIVAPTSAKKTYICGLTLMAGAADNVALVEGTGGTCGTGTAGVAGGTTAANGFNFAANGGIAWPAGKVAHAVTAGTNVDLCLITSSAGPLAGVIKWVQQ
jgi:hypothetical protein